MSEKRASYAQRDEYLDEESLKIPDEQALHGAELLDTEGLAHASPCLEYQGSFRDGVKARIKARYADLTDEELEQYLSLVGG